MSHGLLRVTLCPVCKRPWLGEEITETGLRAYHAATPAPARCRESPTWPRCSHGHAFRAGCLSQPVPPACCAQVDLLTTSSPSTSTVAPGDTHAVHP